MSMTLDPEPLFKRLMDDLPDELHAHVFVVGSLAAAYHFRVRLQRQGVNTKDADLVVHPAGDTISCAGMAERLLDRGWRRHPDCYAATSPEPAEELRVIRLYPPDSTDYFVEFLNLPELGQREIKKWVPVEVGGGWYGLPTFRFLGLSAHSRLRSEQGLEYASPAMMTLSNLLSHPMVRPEQVSQPIGGRKILRSAKDLGRVLAIAQLSTREDVEDWLEPWLAGLRACFPIEWGELARSAGSGLRELLARVDVLEEAKHTCEVGLLRGRGVTLENLAAIGEQVLVDLIEPLEEAGATASGPDSAPDGGSNSPFLDPGTDIRPLRGPGEDGPPA